MALPLPYQTFRTLALEQQLLLVWHEGTFLACRQAVGHTVGLYHVGHFFCEVYYNADTNEIEHLYSFTQPWWLEPYLDDIILGDMPDLKA